MVSCNRDFMHTCSPKNSLSTKSAKFTSPVFEATCGKTYVKLRERNFHLFNVKMNQTMIQSTARKPDTKTQQTCLTLCRLRSFSFVSFSKDNASSIAAIKIRILNSDIQKIQSSNQVVQCDFHILCYSLRYTITLHFLSKYCSTKLVIRGGIKNINVI